MTSQKPTIDPVVTPELVKQHGLTPEEFERIKKILGREPNFTELGIFSVMWSEHCSYKNSRKELKKFPTTGPNILVKAGEENAGVVDIGDGWAIAFKIESHNHPSAIEPFQGAATGVGGIIRDIFTMGARPEFCLNSLRFGPITAQSNSKHQSASGGDPPLPPTDGSSRASSPASRITVTVSASRLSVARFISMKALRVIPWSMFFASVSYVMNNSRAARQKVWAIPFFMSAPRRAATVLPARRSHRVN